MSRSREDYEPLSTQALTLMIYAASGLITRETVWLFAIVAPAMVVPTLIGVRIYARFSEAGFRQLILVLLGLSGVVFAHRLSPTAPQLGGLQRCREPLQERTPDGRRPGMRNPSLRYISPLWEVAKFMG